MGRPVGISQTLTYLFTTEAINREAETVPRPPVQRRIPEPHENYPLSAFDWSKDSSRLSFYEGNQ